MTKAYITNGYASLTGPNLISRGQTVKTSMSANFATCPDLPGFITKLDAYNAAYITALSGGATERALRDQAKADLIADMHTMAYWVMYTCKGDRAQLISSGFPVNKDTDTPSPVPTAAQGQKLKDGVAAGTLDYSFERVPGANNYAYEITEDPITPASVWKSEMGNKIKYTFTGLVSGKRYWVRVQAVGKDGQCACSEPISRISQ